jgi:hypothetical protein
MKTHLLIFCLLLISFFREPLSARAQDSFKEKETYSCTINTQNSTIKFDVLASKESFIADKSLTYYWFSTNKILETRGGYDGKLLDGRFAVFYMNSNLKEKGKFKRGLKDGEWVSWFENGKLMEIVTWKCGLKNGPYRSFDETGRPVLETEYKKGMLHGKMVTYVKGVVTDTREYRNDKEVEPKAPKTKRVRNTKINSDTKQDSQSKKTLKERWNKLFHKKKADKTDTPDKGNSKPGLWKRIFGKKENEQVDSSHSSGAKP